MSFRFSVFSLSHMWAFRFRWIWAWDISSGCSPQKRRQGFVEQFLYFHHRQHKGFVGLLPVTWLFVPHEPWLHDDGYAFNEFEAWVHLFRMHEYPGFDGHRLRVFCSRPLDWITMGLVYLLGVSDPQTAHSCRGEGLMQVSWCLQR